MDRARKDAARHRERLGDAMAAAALPNDPGDALEELIETARAAVASHTEQRAVTKAATQRLERARAELDRRERGARQADVDDAAWRESWAKALSGCWLRNVDPAPSTAAVRRILEDVALLDTTLAKRDEMDDRVRRMERDRGSSC